MKPNDQTRPSSRRGASGAWRRGDRLKPAPADTLELYGLPSKGETRLNDFRTQEMYFQKILERYMRLCAINEKQLAALFASMNQQPTTADLLALGLPHSSSSSSTKPSSTGSGDTKDPTPHAISPQAVPSSPSKNELATVLSSLRKLREGITAARRRDAFVRRAYFFGVHAGVLCKDWESYSPALHALLTVIHRTTPLSAPDLKEYVGLLILDQACRQGDLALAHETRIRFAYKDRRVEMVLRALVAMDWVTFWRVKRAVDGYQRSVMEFAEEDMRVHALKCLGRGYMSADRRFIERCADREWKDLVEDGVGWELVEGETEKVMIRKPKVK